MQSLTWKRAIASLTIVLGVLGGCADISVQTEGVSAFSNDEKRYFIATLQFSQCSLVAPNFRAGIAKGIKISPEPKSTDGVDRYVDDKVGMAVLVEDDKCTVVITGDALEKVVAGIPPTMLLDKTFKLKKISAEAYTGTTQVHGKKYFVHVNRRHASNSSAIVMTFVDVARLKK